MQQVWQMVCGSGSGPDIPRRVGTGEAGESQVRIHINDTRNEGLLLALLESSGSLASQVLLMRYKKLSTELRLHPPSGLTDARGSASKASKDVRSRHG